jgi:DNA-binding LacI/PurR family transcriptional regulator
MKRVTIYAIARACGVSASTVSRALSRPDVVRAEVREQILATARELGYQTNRNARSLATGRTGTIGLLVTDITNPYFPPLIRAIQQAADAVDASIVLVDSEESATTERRLIEKFKGRVDGLLIASPRSGAVLQEKLADLPAVLINRQIRGIPSVICDVTTALQQAGDQVHARGHRRIASIRGPSASWSARQRAEAIADWATRAGVELVDLGARPASFEGGLAAAEAVLDTSCTAVFAFDDLVACGVIAGLARAGEQVPRDRVLIGCDDVLLARTVTPNLTTVATPVTEIGRTAVELLGRRIAGEPVTDVRLTGELVLRDSTAAPPPAPRSERGRR